jgi:hypothetical protein
LGDFVIAWLSKADRGAHMEESSRAVMGSATRRRLANAVPGSLTWLVLACALLGVMVFPGQWLTVVAVFLVWIIARMAVMLVGAVIGERRVKRWHAIDWTFEESVPSPTTGVVPDEVRHIVLLPNYREPLPILSRTLDALAVQHKARERIIVVLATEEREQEAPAKMQRLLAEYAGSFLGMLVTVHPAGLEDEVPGKSSNQAWAAKQAREYVDEIGLDAELVTITSCDSDSVFDRDYFAALSRRFADDPERFYRFWQAPLRYYNNLRQSPFLLRLDLVFMHTAQLATLALPLFSPLPISTYSLSLRLAEESGWWDPSVIAEDWHMYLRSFIAKEGRVRTSSIYLPTLSDIVSGDSTREALSARYHQVVRHAWGAEDVGYLLVSLPKSTVSRPRRAFIFTYVLHDHLLRAVVFCVLFSGTLITWQVGTTHNIVLLWYWWQLGLLLRILYAAASALFIATIGLEVWRRSSVEGTTFQLFAETLGSWVLLPLVGIFSGWLPALHAQTKLMTGVPLHYKVAPKKLLGQPVSPPSRT